MITLHNLITIAPFSEEVKKELLEKVDMLSEGKKLDLMNLCWDTITSWYEEEIHHRYEITMLEMAEGKKEYKQEDLDRISNDVFAELTGKLQEVATQEELQEVREKLEDLTEKPQQQE